MDASSTLLMSGGLLMPRERGDHCDAIREVARGESGRFESISALVAFCYKICGLKRCIAREWRFPVRLMHPCRRLTGDHKWPDRAEFRCFVLNVPLSSVISR
jgi:hypothetical protein